MNACDSDRRFRREGSPQTRGSADPQTETNDVLVRVPWATGVGPWDTKLREGLFGERSFPYVLGIEASGTVENVGKNVADLREGDEVYVYSGGC
jgi:NADPH:quinone reductase-like Zn-dependent oxidoreductase